MRVLFVCSDADVGGAERLLATLARSWSEEDELGLVVLMSRGTLSDDLEAAFSRVTYLDFPPSSRNLPAMVRALEHAITDFAPDVISSHLFHADFVTALARTRVPRVSTMHTHGFGSGDHWLTKVIARAVGALSFRFTAVVPTSDSPAMTTFLRRLRMKHVVTPILNGTMIPTTPSFSTSSRTFVSIARNHPVKGHATLLKAYAAAAPTMPGWLLRVVGAELTIDDPRVQGMIEELDLQPLLDSGALSFDGPTSNPENVLAQSAALVISSLYGETFPLVGLEAAGHGVPVITTDVGNCSHFVDDRRFLVAPGDPDSMRNALSTYAALSDDARAQLSQQARARALRDYDAHAVAERYRTLFRTVVDADTLA